MQAVYLNPLTDFGFKKLFGEEPHKDLLISFLNTLLPEKHQIATLQYRQDTHQYARQHLHATILDIDCLSTTGEEIIIQLQKAKPENFKDRSLYFATFALQAQMRRNDLNNTVSPVYIISLLDFFVRDNRKDVISHLQFKTQNNQVLYDELSFIYLTLPNFAKSRAELKTLQDKWLYVFRHLAELDEIPPELQESVFHKLFQIAQIAQFNPQERQAYEDSLKHYRDLKNSNDTARLEGLQEGLEEGEKIGIEKGRAEGEQIGMTKVVTAMAAKGLDIATIADMTGLPTATVQTLLTQNRT